VEETLIVLMLLAVLGRSASEWQTFLGRPGVLHNELDMAGPRGERHLS